MTEVVCNTVCDSKVQAFLATITSQFYARTKTEGRKLGNEALFHLDLQVKVENNTVYMIFSGIDDEAHCVSFPIPYTENGVSLICKNEVVRAVCNFWDEETQTELDYVSIMHLISLNDCSRVVKTVPVKKYSFLQKVIYGFCNGNAAIIVNQFQKAIDEVINKMPLHETFMNSWAMNKRLVILDDEFDQLVSPEDKLNYHREKAMKYFDRGWTTLGLSDGSLADKNYILKEDLRKYSPFGTRFHNPQRNLYSTLNMKGDELPNIRSESMQKLIENGITRTGWNLVTAYVDIPDVFEDQIVVDVRHRDKFVTNERRFQVFGKVVVKEGEVLKYKHVLGILEDGCKSLFETRCDHAVVKKIVKSFVNIGGRLTDVHNVVVEYKRNFRDGFKITNLHGNKGVIRLKKLGTAINPVTGKEVPIDVIVGAKTVGKRKNFGQIIEILMNNILEASGVNEPVVFPDNWYKEVEATKRKMAELGFNEDCTWECNTYAGEVKAVVGKVFWGCIKTPEDQVWEENETVVRNGKEVRTKGLKFSHVEFRALKTRLGNSNPVIDEILSYTQGTENLHDLIKMAASKRGLIPTDKQVLNINQIREVDQTFGIIMRKESLSGTVVDEYFMPDGFLLRLPEAYQTVLNEKEEVVYEGPVQKVPATGNMKAFQTDYAYVPSGALRKCWKHENGMYGLSDVGVVVNNLVLMMKRYLADQENYINRNLYYKTLFSYFDYVSSSLCCKRGDIATLGMSVRYPVSAKAVATLSNNLPKNVVEIHDSMAKVLHVKNDDVILAERFPCLGFMSVVPQKVRITTDEMCRYTIRVSKNSLVSTNLDHDGDVLFLAAFMTPAAKMALKKEFDSPNKTCHDELEVLNNRKGVPHTKCYTIDDFNISQFNDLTCEEHANIVEKNTGVKAQTGPVIALTYNLMRIVENSELSNSHKIKVAIEMFLEKAAQSVFEQKHGGKSLYEIVIDGVCTCDVETLVKVGFKRGTTEKLCTLVTQKANSIGIFDLKKYHKEAKEKGFSNIISKIVRMQNRIYYASRAKIEATTLFEILDSPAVDIPSSILKWTMSGKAEMVKTELDKVFTEEKIAKAVSPSFRNACSEMIKCVEATFRRI